MADKVSSPFGDAEDMDILNSEDEVGEDSEDLGDSESGTDDTEDVSEDSEDESDGDEESGDDEEDGEEDEEKDGLKEEDLDKRVGGFSSRPTFREVNKAFPGLFKKFPELRVGFFREEQFTELFPTVEDAQEAVEQLTQYRAVEKTVTSGEPAEYLELLGELDKETATKFALKFLPTISATNQELFQDITKPFLKHVLRNIHKGAGTNENLANAVYHIHKELFGDFDLDKAPAVKALRESAPKDENYENEKRQFYQRQELAFRGDVTNHTKNELEKELNKLIDPKNTLSDYDRRNIRRDVLDDIDAMLTKDKQHMNIMGSLWNRAKKSGYSSEYKDRIKTAYLSRVKVLLPGVVSKKRSEALAARGKSMRAIKKTDSLRNVNGSSPSRNSSRFKEDDIDYSASSDLDILNDTPKLKNRK